MCKKTELVPKKGIVYECYRGMKDRYGDRVRIGQKFIINDIIDGKYYLDKASGRGVDIVINAEDFVSHFRSVDTPVEKDVTPTPEFSFDVEAHLVKGTWDDVKEEWDKIPVSIQKLILKAKPDLFREVFEFKMTDNKFGTGDGLPFFVGLGLVKDEDKLKSLVVYNSWKVELFTGPNGHQCIRFIRK